MLRTSGDFAESSETGDIPLSDWLVGKKAVANALGVSVSTVKRYLKRYPDFPGHRRGATIYVSREVLVAWVTNRNVKRCPTCGGLLPKTKKCMLVAR